MKILSQSVDSVLNVLRRPNTVKSVSETAPHALNLSESSVQFNHGYNTAHSSYSARDHSHNMWIRDTDTTSYITDQLNIFKQDPRFRESRQRKMSVNKG